MYKYTVVTAVLRGTNSMFFHQTRTVFGAVGGVLGYRECCKSNNILQNGDISRLFRCYFRLF